MKRTNEDADEDVADADAAVSAVADAAAAGYDDAA